MLNQVAGRDRVFRALETLDGLAKYLRPPGGR
jgi:hypothetical protein